MPIRHALLLAALLSIAGCGPDYLDQVREDLSVGNYSEAEAELKRVLYDDPSDQEAAAHLVAARLLQLPDSVMSNGALGSNQIMAALLLEPSNFARHEPDVKSAAANWLAETRSDLRQQLRRDGIETESFEDVKAIAQGVAGVLVDLHDDRMRRTGEASDRERSLMLLSRVVQAWGGDEEAARQWVQHLSAEDEGYTLQSMAPIIGEPLRPALVEELAKPSPLLPRRQLQLALALLDIRTEAERFAADYPKVRRVRDADVNADLRGWWSGGYDPVRTLKDEGANPWIAEAIVAQNARWTSSATRVPAVTALSVDYTEVSASPRSGDDTSEADRDADAAAVFMIQGFDPSSRKWVMRFFALNGAGLRLIKHEGEAGGTDVTSQEPVRPFLSASGDTLNVAVPPGDRQEKYVDTEEYYNPNKYVGYYGYTSGGYDTRTVTRNRTVNYERALRIPVSVGAATMRDAKTGEYWEYYD